MTDAIYIHIPFCVKKCGYCDFLSFRSTKEQRDRYVNKLIDEIGLYPKLKYDTIYFGGGTPSILEPYQVEKILKELDFDDNTEITLEVNPKTVDTEKLKHLKEIGINRLSIGVQSFNEIFLKKLGRIHSKDEGINTYNIARSVGFKNISIDLMFSLPDQKIDELKEDLKMVFFLKPEHFSIYSLIWEEGTPFYEKLLSGEYHETDNDIEADMYKLIIDESKKNGYHHYEISNFCKENFESKHNTKYWRNKEYIGVGLGASGYFNGVRYKNTSDFGEYFKIIEEKKFPIIEKEIVDEELKEEYRHILGLRLLEEGISQSDKEKYLEKYQLLKKNDYLIEKEINNEKRYILTEKGLFLANEVFEEFI